MDDGGIQLWVNLPSKDKMTSPRYQNLEGEQSALLSSPDGGALRITMTRPGCNLAAERDSSRE